MGVAHSRAGGQNVFFEKVSYSIQGGRGRCQGTELDVPDRSGAVRWPYTYRRQYNFVGPPGPQPTIPKAPRRRRQRRSRRRAFSFPSFPLGAPLGVPALVNGANAVENGANALANGQNALANGESAVENGEKTQLQLFCRKPSVVR